MAKMTVLEMVQDIMSDMNSDNVNDINDTPESLRAAQIVQSVYNEIIDNRNWPHLRTITQLENATTDNKVKMAMPIGFKEVESIRYNKRKVTDTKDIYREITYLMPEDFLDVLNGRNSAESNVDTIVDYGLTKLFIRNDKQPEWWTSFDDEFIVFDSYDTAVDSTLQGSKTQVVAYTDPSFTLANSFTPDLPSEAFSAFLAEAKSVCFARIKQAPDEKSEQQARRQQRWLSRKAWKSRGGVTYPDFGRRRRGGFVRRTRLLDRDAT